MIGLNGSLSIASEALSAQYAGLEVTNNNIANVNTPGYARQVVSLNSAALVQSGVSVDEGVSYAGYTGVRDQVLGLAVNAKTSDQASLTAQSALLGGVDSSFASSTSGIGASLSSLFSDLSALSTNPSDTAARQVVIGDLNRLADAYHEGASVLSSASKSSDEQVVSTVAQVNQLTSQIAAMNGQLAEVTGGTQDGGALEDQRDALTTQLAKLVGVSVIQTAGAPTLTTSNGSPLVIGSKSFTLQVATASDGTARILDAQGDDITNKLTGGTLGGAIAVRDNTIPSLSQQLDGLASQFAVAMNSAQTSGYDANGNPGAPMFSLPSSGSDAAGISVALTNGDAIAASSDGSANSSGNLGSLLAVQANNLPSGSNPTDTYASFVGNVGLTAWSVQSQLAATTATLQQLTNQQSSTSGVSIDEETANLIRYQKAYAAAANVISTINGLFTVLMNMTGTGVGG